MHGGGCGTGRRGSRPAGSYGIGHVRRASRSKKATTEQPCLASTRLWLHQLEGVTLALRCAHAGTTLRKLSVTRTTTTDYREPTDYREVWACWWFRLRNDFTRHLVRLLQSSAGLSDAGWCTSCPRPNVCKLPILPKKKKEGTRRTEAVPRPNCSVSFISFKMAFLSIKLIWWTATVCR